MAKIILSNERLEGIKKGNVKGRPWAKFKFLYGQRPGLNRPNLFMLLFFVPIIVAIFVLNMANGRVNAEPLHYANIGVGFPFAPYAAAQADALIKLNTQWFMLSLVVAALIFSLAFVGATKVIRNGLVSISADSEGNATTSINHKRDFFKGIKENWLPAFIVFLLFGALANGMYYLHQIIITFDKAIYIVTLIAAILVAALIFIFGMFFLVLSVGYKQKLFKTVKNAFFMTFQNIISNIVALVLTGLPLAILLLNIQLVSLIVLMYYAMIGFSITVYVWVYQSTRIENRYPKYKSVNN